jgi:hypothetical protein
MRRGHARKGMEEILQIFDKLFNTHICLFENAM